jgi:ATP-binding cassette, subfamily B, bacterial PglK
MESRRLKPLKGTETYNIFHIFNGILKRIPARRRALAWIILCGLIFTAILETVVIGMTAFFVAVLADPASASTSRLFSLLNIQPLLRMMNTPGSLALAVGVLMLGLVIAKNTAKAMVNYSYQRFSGYVASYIGGRVLDLLMAAPYEWHLNKNSADLALGVFWRQFVGKVVNAVLEILSDGFIVAVILIMLLVMEPVISAVVIVILGGCAAAIFLIVKRYLDRTLKKLKDYRQTINKEVTQAMHGIKDVRVFGREPFFRSRYTGKAYTEARIEARQLFLAYVPEWLLEIAGFFILIFMVFILFTFMTRSGADVTGTVALFAVSFFRILPSMNRIVRRSAQARNFIPFAQNCLNYLDELESIAAARKPQPQGTVSPLPFEKSIDARGLCFRYEKSANDVLKDVSFPVPKGQTIGIIGTSGAGKSTLADIIIGLLSPKTGRISVDEVPLHSGNFSIWRQHIGYVPQTPYMCDGTLAENIAFGIDQKQIDRKRIQDCCKMAALQELVKELPDGIDSLIGERGAKLSGGQRQRVAIARALYNSPDILIFDEATSSLDQQNEQAILHTIYGFKGKQTMVIIAHRLSTVENCDHIIWLEHGRVRRIGTPDDILPEYRREMTTNLTDQPAVKTPLRRTGAPEPI